MGGGDNDRCHGAMLQSSAEEIEMQFSALAVQAGDGAVAAYKPVAPGSNVAIGGDSDSWRDDTLQSSAEDKEMALLFSRWFYPMWNSLQPRLPRRRRVGRAFLTPPLLCRL